MEIYERVHELRKNHLKMSMAAFGARLGVSLDVISNIEGNRLANLDQKVSLFKLMCKEFNVNEEWLFEGKGSVFVIPDTFSIDQYMNDRGATALEISIVKAYFDLDRETRENLIEHFREFVLNDLADPAQDAAAPSGSVGDAEAAYIKSRSGNARNAALSASNTTAGTDTRGENAVNE